MLNALTGITTPYFFLKIEKPLIGYFKRALTLFTGASSPKHAVGTSHNSIFPSVPNERIL
jgi:hypothetical protein